jgi:hypothetical protein
MTPNATPKKIPMPTLSGWKYRATHKASVTAILGVDTRPVSSRGSMFMNVDRWTGRKLIDVFCRWCRDKDGAVPTKKDIKIMVAEVNRMPHPSAEIVIAHTPDALPQRIAMALVGGAYHEAWHTKYSRRTTLSVDEVAKIILPRHAKVANWGKYTKLLLQWANVADDIRIERVGRKEFPGTEVKMHDLQDFILQVEEKSRQEVVRMATEHGVKNPEKKGIPNTLSIVMCLYRDIGLGYNTNSQRLILDKYKEWNPEACKMVLDGPLSEILRENIKQTATDDLGCLRSAMDVVAVLDELTQDGEGEDGEPQEGDQGSLDKCPQCGAPAEKLKLRPAPNQGSLKGASTVRGVITCTVCGWQTEVDLKKAKQEAKDKAEESSGGGTGINMPGGKGNSGGTGEQQQKGGIQAEGFEDWLDDEEEEEEEDATGGKDGEQDGEGGDEEGEGSGKGDKDGDQKSSGKGSSGDGDDDGVDGDEDGEGSGGSGKDGEKDEDGFGDVAKDVLDGAEDGADMQDSSSALGKELGGEEDEEGEDGGDGDDKGKGQSQTPPQNSDKQTGAGGYYWDGDKVNPTEFNDVAKDIQQQATDGATLADSESALNQEFQTFDDKQQKRNVKTGEAPYRPYSMDRDSVSYVQPSTAGKQADARRADNLFKSVKVESSYLRSRFRTVFRALNIVDTTHGLRRGKAISDRMLVDSKACLLSGEVPNRAYYDVSETVDTSVAACIVLDQSGSMSGTYQRLATQIMCAITEPLDAVGSAVQVVGFRNGSWYGHNPEPGFHRSEAIHHDIFKAFEEKFKSVRWRFANTRAEGSTPMSDGVQFALDALNKRSEGHRIVFVVTDGYPDHNHRAVIQRQIRVAKESNVHIIGVGIGGGADYVRSLFVDHVWSKNFEQMPKLLVAKLNELLERRLGKRNKKIRSTA